MDNEKVTDIILWEVRALRKQVEELEKKQNKLQFKVGTISFVFGFIGAKIPMIDKLFTIIGR
jgi:hypothetical protein